MRTRAPPFHAWESPRAEFAACYANDARPVGLSGKRPPIEGRAAIRRAYASLAAKEPRAFGVEILRRTVSGPIVVDLERTLVTCGVAPGRLRRASRHAPRNPAGGAIRPARPRAASPRARR
ncbi:hypothetical protein SAMN02927913_0749 [Frateuria terrea]|nr:hypothetical protein SAMN02927913_0749 [Frateuria terrea]